MNYRKTKAGWKTGVMATVASLAMSIAVVLVAQSRSTAKDPGVRGGASGRRRAG